MIKDYISRNYMNDTLSVKDISSHVYLSASTYAPFSKVKLARLSISI